MPLGFLISKLDFSPGPREGRDSSATNTANVNDCIVPPFIADSVFKKVVSWEASFAFGVPVMNPAIADYCNCHDGVARSSVENVMRLHWRTWKWRSAHYVEMMGRECLEECGEEDRSAAEFIAAVNRSTETCRT